MAQKDTELQQFLNKEVEKYRGIAVPVRTSMLRRMFTRHIPCDKLHPNPDDEFCDPEIGPNYGIITGYETEFRRFGNDAQAAALSGARAYEPIVVQKIRPDGYMIMNGHHRWAAAMRAGLPAISVEIVNLTQPKDIQKMLAAARNTKRVAMDLDEVVFCDPATEPAEKKLAFPWKKLYPQSIRLGIPALIYNLNQNKYDIWLYTSQYYSDDHIRRMLNHYHAQVKFVITGTERKSASGKELKTNTEKLAAQKYRTTFHVDRSSVLQVNSGDKTFTEFPIAASAPWSAQVQAIFKKLDR